MMIMIGPFAVVSVWELLSSFQLHPASFRLQEWAFAFLHRSPRLIARVWSRNASSNPRAAFDSAGFFTSVMYRSRSTRPSARIFTLCVMRR